MTEVLWEGKWHCYFLDLWMCVTQKKANTI